MSANDVRLPLCGFLAASLASLKYLRHPYVTIGLVLAVLCCWIAWRRKRVRFVLVNAAVALATLAAAEAWFARSDHPTSSYTVVDDPRIDYVQPDDVLGVIPRPNVRVVQTQHKSDGSEVFRAEYTIDPRGLRVTPERDVAPGIVFFGCSFTFGEGVGDESSMPYRVGVLQPTYEAHNFGFHGYGPHQMLATIESGRMEQLVTTPPRFVIYQMIPDHVARVVGRVRYLRHAPAYGLVEGQVRNLGHFDDFPISDSIRRLMEKSSLYSQLIEPRLLSSADVELTVSIVKRARDLILERFPDCQFAVLFWDQPQEWLSGELQEQMRRSSLNVHLMSEILPEYADRVQRYKIPGDRHPNTAAHDLVARYVVSRIVQSAAGGVEEELKIGK
jgi:hypothetical protein